MQVRLRTFWEGAGAPLSPAKIARFANTPGTAVQHEQMAHRALRQGPCTLRWRRYDTYKPSCPAPNQASALPPTPTHQAADSTARLLLVGLTLSWGLTWPALRIVLDEMPPFSMRVATSALGTSVLFMLAALQRRDVRLHGIAWLHVAVAGFLNIAAFTVLTALGQIGTLTSRVIILGYSMPIWACLLAVPILGERIDRTRGIALTLCAAGVVTLISPLIGSGAMAGPLFALAAGVCWAAGTVYMKWSRIAGDPIAIAGWQLVVAVVVTAAAVPIFEGSYHLVPTQPRTMMALAFAGLVGSGLSYILWFTAVRRLPAMTVSLGVLSVPVSGIAASALILGERPTVTDYIGCALILAAAACVLLTPTARTGVPIEPAV
jgi:drug/metabolite transporter (DMT)-like permease